MRVEVFWPAVRGWGHRGGIAPRGCKNRSCPLLRRGSGQPDDQSGVTDQGVRRSRAASWILPAETGSRASLPRSDHTTRTRRAWRRRAASWHRCLGGENGTRSEKRPRGASGVDTGDVARLGQGAGPTRTTQGRRVGRLEPKLHSLGVAGEFGHLPESAKNKRRGRRACPTAPLGAHGAMASARRARRRRRRLAWCARMGGITKSLGTRWQCVRDEAARAVNKVVGDKYCKALGEGSM